MLARVELAVHGLSIVHKEPESEITSPYWLDISPVKGTFDWTFC